MKSNDSIIFRNGLTMGGIVLLALLSMTSSVFIAESSKGDAAALNLAGSLRMQSYRIATRLQDSHATPIPTMPRRWLGKSTSSNAAWIISGKPARSLWPKATPRTGR
jgi:nitrate/nitrite-specific signal transduction histidine kinase